MDIRKLNQVVFVVIDHEAERVLGIFNEYKDAKKVAIDMEMPGYNGLEISITPVLVDTVNQLIDSRVFGYDEQEVLDGMQEEIDLALPEEEEEEEEEEDWDEDEDEDWDEDENEDEDDDIDNLLYELNGVTLINHKDAEIMLSICKQYARAKYHGLSEYIIEAVAEKEFTDIMKRWGAERVDMRE